MFAIVPIGIPILGSFLTLIADRFSGVLRNALAVLIVLATFVGCLALIPYAKQSRTIMVGPSSLPGLNFNFVIDGLGVFMAIMSSLIGLLIVFYSMGYMSEYKYQGEYYFLVVMFLGAMVGLVLSANLLLIYIFWEITAICSWRLIGFYRQPQHLRNADTALMMTVFGSFLMLVGLEMIWHETGSLNLNSVHGQPISNLALFFIYIGILAKSAQVPLQVWLPGAGVAAFPGHGTTACSNPGSDRRIRLCTHIRGRVPSNAGLANHHLGSGGDHDPGSGRSRPDGKQRQAHPGLLYVGTAGLCYPGAGKHERDRDHRRTDLPASAQSGQSRAIPVRGDHRTQDPHAAICANWAECCALCRLRRSLSSCAC